VESPRRRSQPAGASPRSDGDRFSYERGGTDEEDSAARRRRTCTPGRAAAAPDDAEFETIPEDFEFAPHENGFTDGEDGEAEGWHVPPGADQPLPSPGDDVEEITVEQVTGAPQIVQFTCVNESFSTLTLLVGRQERHPACKRN